jgi:hypothetical protein
MEDSKLPWGKDHPPLGLADIIRIALLLAFIIFILTEI